MARLIILIAVIGIALIVWSKISKAKGDKRKKLVYWSIAGGIGAILLVLAVTGHLNLITAMIAGLVALVPRLMSLLKYLPFFSRMYQQHQSQKPGQQAPAAKNANMGKDEAMEILGLKDGYNKEDVIQAHRRMMQKNHPDRGGSDHLAAQINTAKDALLG